MWIFLYIFINNFIISGSIGKEIDAKYKERRNGPNYKRKRTALDDLASLERKEKETEARKCNTDSEFDFSDVEINVSKNLVDYSSDSSRQGTRFAKRTGVFDIDFPPSAKVSKVDSKHAKKSSKVKLSRQNITTNCPSEVDSNFSASESDPHIQQLGFVKSSVNYDSTEATSTNDEDVMLNVNMGRGRYSRKKGKISNCIY